MKPSLSFSDPAIRAELPQVSGMLPLPDRWQLPEEANAAAVCMLFVPDPSNPLGPALVLLTRRAAHLRSHSGQIGFPGGGRDSGERTPAVTALRELEEEMGIGADKVLLHGSLPSLSALDGRVVLPVVATSTSTPHEWQANPSEVAEVILAPWPSLTQASAEHLTFTLFGIKRHSHLFQSSGHKIWGLTASMIFSANLSK